MNIGQTIDELPSFSTTPSLGSYFAIRDMSVASTVIGATKKFSISDFILLFQIAQGLCIAKTTLVAGTQTVSFPSNATFSIVPEVGILRIVDPNGQQLGGTISISNITTTGFDVDAIEACVLTYFLGNLTADMPTNPLAWLVAAEDDVLQYKSGAWINRTMAELAADLVLSGYQPLATALTQLSAITFSANDIIQYKSGSLINRTLLQLKTDLSLENVDNTSDINKPISTATQAALNAKCDIFIWAYKTTFGGAITRYIYPFNLNQSTSTTANENACWKLPRTGTIKNLSVSVDFGNSNTLVVTLFKNGSATTLTSGTITGTGTSSGFALDSTHTISCSAQDKLEFQIVSTSANSMGFTITAEVYYP